MSKRGARWMVVALVAMLGLAGCRREQAAPATDAPGTAAPAAAADGAPKVVPHAGSAGVLAALETTLQGVYGTLNKSVVNIAVTQTRTVDERDMGEMFPFGPQPFGERRGRPRSFSRSGSGSGFVWDQQGHIVTNNHVVAQADKIRVTFSDGTTVAAKRVGTDPDSDLAVLKIEVARERLAPVTMADSTQVKVGQLAVALGNPFGLEGSMTVGFISALGRLLPTQTESDEPSFTIPDVLQTDAPINPGNSGGVLANSAGSIIGVTSAIISPAGANAGIGFAIPSAVVVKVVPALIAKGRYEHAYLGLVGVSMSPELAKAMGLQEDQRGALVVDVVPGSPSDKAGLRGSDRRLEVDGAEARVGGDVVVALGNKPTRSFDDLVTELARVGEVGKSLSLTVLRGGKQQQLSVQLTARPAKRGGDDQPQPTAGAAADGVKLGVVASTLTPTLAKAMALKDDQKGVLVQQVEHGGAADRAGLKGSFKPLPGRQRLLVGGDVIVALNSQPVTDMESLQAGLAKLKAGDSATLTVLREGKRQDLKASFSKADQE